MACDSWDNQRDVQGRHYFQIQLEKNEEAAFFKAVIK